MKMETDEWKWTPPGGQIEDALREGTFDTTIKTLDEQARA